MLCPVCSTKMIFLYEVDYGDKDIRVYYGCPKCKKREIVYKSR